MSLFEIGVLFVLFMIFVCLWKISETFIVLVKDHQFMMEHKLSHRGPQDD